MVDEQKKMDIKEFREKGYFQELNRRFLHPLGLALVIKRMENGEEVLGGIADYREDKEGVLYGLANADEVRKQKFLKNEKFVDTEYKKRMEVRKQMFGEIVEPIFSTMAITESMTQFLETKTETTMETIAPTGLKAEVLEDMKTAMKEKNHIKLEAIRAVKASFDKFEKENPGKEIN